MTTSGVIILVEVTEKDTVSPVLPRGPELDVIES